MSVELTVLTLAALLQGLQFVVYAVPANREIGPGYTMSARDREPSRELSHRTARLGRALDNHFEGLILFGIAVGVVQMSAQNTAFTPPALGSNSSPACSMFPPMRSACARTARSSGSSALLRPC